MSAVENIYLVFAVSAFAGFWLLLFVTWMLVEVLPSPQKSVAAPDGERPAETTKGRKAA